MNFFTVILLVLKIVLLGSVWQIAQANESENQANLVIEPASPIVAKGQLIRFKVYGAKGNIECTEEYGGECILKEECADDNIIYYVAPDKEGKHYIKIKDQSNQQKIISITVLTEEGLKRAFSPENSHLEVFTNRNLIQAIVFSEDGRTLWVATEGGLEQRDAKTGKLEKIFTSFEQRDAKTGDLKKNVEGLPDNHIKALVSDGNNGLWIGTKNSGLVHFTNNKFTGFDIDNSDLPSNEISVLMNDNHGGVWIGTYDTASEKDRRVVHLNADGRFQLFNTLSELQNIYSTAFVDDGKSGLWIGSNKGLIHLTKDEKLTVFNSDNSELPWDNSEILASDGDGGLWLGGMSNKLVHLDNKQEWNFFELKNFLNIQDIQIDSLVNDGNGGVWVGFFDNGLIHLNSDGEWTDHYNTDISDLPDNHVTTLVNDNNGKLWVGTWGSGMAYLNFQNDKWKIFSHPSVPSNNISSLATDGHGGLWVGSRSDYGRSNLTYTPANNGGLAHLSNTGKWTLFNTSNYSELLSHNIRIMTHDDNDGVWMGTYDFKTKKAGGLLHLPSINDELKIFNTDNSDLQKNYINALESDGNGGVWVGTFGLAHLESNGKWTIFDTENSDLPDNFITSLLNDGKGGVWIGGLGSLTHLNSRGEWTPLNTDNSVLTNDYINVLENDGGGGLWIGTEGNGIIHLGHCGKWTVFNSNTTDSQLPNNFINSLESDGTGGVWIGMEDLFNLKGDGLVHLTGNKVLTIFNIANSYFSDDWITTLISDNKGGYWLGTYSGGLAHLTFGQKYIICNTPKIITDDQCDKLLKGSRTAILIHPNAQNNAVDFMATYIYQTLLMRGYYDDEIYYLSYKPDLDFNGDRIADPIVDAPSTLAKNPNGIHDLTVNDVKIAFELAKEKSLKAKEDGVPEEPLLVIFVGHGLKNELILSPSDDRLDETSLKSLIGDYQTETGNQVVVTLEACHSGTLIDKLKGKDRVIITSTGEELAYYSDLGKISFTSFYFEQLYAGVNYLKGWESVKNESLPKLRRLQNPQLEDFAENSKAQEMCLNGCFGKRPEPNINELEFSPRYVSNDASYIKLIVDIEEEKEAPITKVSATVITPQYSDNEKYDDYGYEIKKSVTIDFIKKSDTKWTANFNFKDNNLSEFGEYKFLFKIDYKIDKGTRIILAKKPKMVYIKPKFCKQYRACFDPKLRRLYIPAIIVPTDDGEKIYQADLLLQNESFIFELEHLKITDNLDLSEVAQFEPNTGIVHIPKVEVPNDNANNIEIYTADLQQKLLIPQTELLKEPPQFILKSINPL